MNECINPTEPFYAFVDGSFNPKTNVYGYGGFLSVKGRKYKLQGAGNNPDAAKTRNIAGEILGATKAIKTAIDCKIPEITIYYDYMGIEMWATGGWKANRDISIKYANFIQNANKLIKINFVHVPAHTGIQGNEIADTLAKQAVGVS